MPRTSRPDQLLIDYHAPHGTVARYVRGCRCEACCREEGRMQVDIDRLARCRSERSVGAEAGEEAPSASAPTDRPLLDGYEKALASL